MPRNRGNLASLGVFAQACAGVRTLDRCLAQVHVERVRYLALACDYDGTVAHDGVVDGTTLAAFARLRATGRKLILVTGRELDDLRRVMPEIAAFDVVVAENGAVLYWPAAGEEWALAGAPPPAFLEALEARGVEPIGRGRVIVATWQPNGEAVQEIIRELGFRLQVILNKGAVMVLPEGVDKRSGLEAALDELGLSFASAVAVGDAENDLAFLTACGCSVAVANALDVVKNAVDFVTTGHHGDGVCELIDALIADDLAAIARRAHV